MTSMFAAGKILDRTKQFLRFLSEKSRQEEYNNCLHSPMATLRIRDSGCPGSILKQIGLDH